MWNWSEQRDNAFKVETYRIKVDGYIIGSVRKLGQEWSWEVKFPLLKMPDGCQGTRPTLAEARTAIEDKFDELTGGMSKQDAYTRMMKGIWATPRKA